jgi:uncharacterized membrane protein
MNNDLIVMTFKNEQDALKARGALEIMHNSPFLGARDAFLVTRDIDGEFVFHHQKLQPVGQTESDSQIPGLIVNLLFGDSEDGLQKLVAAGLDEKCLKKAKSELVPGSSLILIRIRYESLVDTQQVLDALNQFNGRLYHTTLAPDIEEVMLNQEPTQIND